MHGLYVASDEDEAKYPDFLRKAEKRLAKAQRKLSQKQKEVITEKNKTACSYSP